MKKKIVLFIVLALLLTQMPIIGKYFSIVNTLIHEMGHSLMAIITGGKVQSISLFSNTEGATLTSYQFWIGGFLTSASGYVFSSFIAFLFMILIYKGKSKYVLTVLLGVLVVSLLFWIRNPFGLFWIVTFIAGFSWTLVKGSKVFLEYVALFLTTLLLVESITSSFQVMYLSFISPQSAGDATNLSRMTRLIPAPIWGVLFFIQSLYFGKLGLNKFFRKKPSS
ncbi:M50 family metallopeptidase [Aquibacillus rhizosphaerae]|uniref:M50 family metallopeptidase n=1 Tax=Aquibacillus rhizosphaerae TaxID=3051431 RepID=A0ABT7LBC8_9BACI|nr:M50 family metallopeptidase [Aquibacillus sp. LR5S19]MDL4843158.1 M50 family metallopeptidase [Aquibacillus sp. LR5S19]